MLLFFLGIHNPSETVRLMHACERGTRVLAEKIVCNLLYIEEFEVLTDSRINSLSDFEIRDTVAKN
jgi:hypothetical protein